MQEFGNLSEILKNPQMLAMLSQAMQTQNKPENNNVKVQNTELSKNAPESPGNINMQMLANLLPLLNNGNFANILGTLSNNGSQVNNMQNMIMLINLISQMQKNNKNPNDTEKNGN